MNNSETIFRYKNYSLVWFPEEKIFVLYSYFNGKFREVIKDEVPDKFIALKKVLSHFIDIVEQF